jgi:predicted lactoylglutathione lyase
MELCMPDRPVPRLTVITLGVADMRASIRFYEQLGLSRRMRGTGEEVAFFAAGGVILALFPWDQLAADADLSDEPPQAFRGSTLAWNCASRTEVDAALAHALNVGAKLLKPAGETSYGGYRGYFADPDGHCWEVVVAPGFELTADGRVRLPD